MDAFASAARDGRGGHDPVTQRRIAGRGRRPHGSRGRSGTALRDQSPSGSSGLRLRLEAAPFDTLVTWLANLQQQHGVGIEAATIDAAGPGLVNATLSLTQAGAAG